MATGSAAAAAGRATAAETRLRRAGIIGGVLCIASLSLVWWSPLYAGAVALELLAAAFWWWARFSNDRDDQITRWAWLRRPAAALWIAAAAEAILSGARLGASPADRGVIEVLLWIEALGVGWAGLELLAALPLERPFSDRPGPLPSVGAWLPALLPAFGFLILWRHVAHWTSIPPVRTAVLLLLLVTALLAALRAFSRRRMEASLRWLAVADSALAGALVATREVPLEVSLVLWLAAYGGRSALLAGEIRGSAPRRSPAASQLWRASGWIASACLSWPLLLALTFGQPGLAHPAWAVGAGLAVLVVAWTAVRRTTDLPERRKMVRREPALPITQLAASLTLIAGPAALLMAWWSGYDPARSAGAFAIAPALVGGGAAWLRNQRPDAATQPSLGGWGQRLRSLASAAFGSVVGLEQRLVSLLRRIGLAIVAPTRDLHTGDAQEYLIFLVGLTVLALVLPLLG
jgi:hypothetical protein